MSRAINWQRPQFRRGAHGSFAKHDEAERIKDDTAARWLGKHDPAAANARCPRCRWMAKPGQRRCARCGTP